jgi:hypothetical protein
MRLQNALERDELVLDRLSLLEEGCGESGEVLLRRPEPPSPQGAPRNHGNILPGEPGHLAPSAVMDRRQESATRSDIGGSSLVEQVSDDPQDGCEDEGHDHRCWG